MKCELWAFKTSLIKKNEWLIVEFLDNFADTIPNKISARSFEVY